MTDPVSPHFDIIEVTHSNIAARLGIDNSLPDSLWGNVKAAAVGLELVRHELNSNPIIVSSWYRCPALNEAVGSKPTSAHLTGYAIDFVCPTAGTPEQIVAALIKSKVPFDQVIKEFVSADNPNSGWVHISFAPTMRQQALVIDAEGTRAFA